jgi:hypothetical protein
MHLGIIGLAPIGDRFILFKVTKDSSKDGAHVVVSRVILAEIDPSEQCYESGCSKKVTVDSGDLDALAID